MGAAAVTGGVVDLVLMDEVLFTAAGREGSFSAGLGRRVRGGGFGLASESAEDSLLLREGDLIKYRCIIQKNRDPFRLLANTFCYFVSY